MQLVRRSQSGWRRVVSPPIACDKSRRDCGNGRWRAGAPRPICPAALRPALDEAFPLRRLELRTHQVSSDGTEKFLWALADGEAIESVLIPEGKRRTLCISSQAGCALGCVFCATGRMGFRRNLTAGEIASQVREQVIRDPSLRPTNIVFMEWASRSSTGTPWTRR